MLFPVQRTILVFALLLMAAIAHADPENFIVDGFTFVRPPEWKWVANDKLADKGLLLRIQGASTNNTASVYFRTFNGDEGTAEKRIKGWRGYYKESPNSLKVRSATKTVGSFKVVYVEMEGKSDIVSGKEFSLIATIIQMKGGTFVARMSGRKKLVDDSKTTFTEMVEHALKEKQPD